ncbi:MAG: hypothetical protein ACK5LE_08205 [Alphaproteobacteria bacterium]
MLFKAMLSDVFAKDARMVAKRTEEVLEPMNIQALQDYVTRLENQRKMSSLISRIFLGALEVEAANSSDAVVKKAVNS